MSSFEHSNIRLEKNRAKSAFLEKAEKASYYNIKTYKIKYNSLLCKKEFISCLFQKYIEVFMIIYITNY